jgi:phosphatidate cytidylyltransferase
VTRFLSALALLAVFGALAWLLPPEGLVVVAAAIAVAGFLELARLGEALGARVPRASGILLTVLVCVSAAWPGLSLTPAVVALLVGAGLVAVTAGVPDRAGAGGVALVVAGPLYLGLPLGMLVSIGWTHGREVALLAVLTVVASDSSQYYAGRLFGRTPLAPAISPKKTVEGALGGFVGGAVLLGWLGGVWLPSLPLGMRLGLAVVLVAVGIIGDLLESALKRAAAVKDSSHVIPGHGGVLDRIDALLLVTPVFGLALAAASRWGS